MESRIVTRVLTVGENCDSCAHGGRELCPRWENYSGKVWIWNWIGAERLKWSKGKNLSRAHGGRIIKARCVCWWWNCRGLFRSLLCQYALACYYDITVLCHLWHLWHLSCHMCAPVTSVTQHVTILNCDILEGLLWILQLQIINQWSIQIKIGTLSRKKTFFLYIYFHKCWWKCWWTRNHINVTMMLMLMLMMLLMMIMIIF